MSKTPQEPTVLQQLCDERSKENREAISRLEARVAALEHSLNGNGEPGIKARLVLVEKSVTTHSWLLGIAIGALVTGVIGIVLKRVAGA